MAMATESDPIPSTAGVEKTIDSAIDDGELKETDSIDKNGLVEEGMTEEKDEEETQYPPFAKVLLILMALYCSMFLVALDRTIIGTAIPRISDQFHALDDIGWYGSAYLLTTCCFQLLFGRIYTFYSPKMVFLTAVVIFEIGSALCGAAPNSTAFIFGRAIAGMGSAGIYSGTVVIMMYTTPIEKRPMYVGFVGAVFGIASVAGPLLGGVFTSKVSWRWCFYINLPIGAVTLVIIVLVLQLPNPKDGPKTFKEQINRLDPIGCFFFFPGIICLLLALQWGGSTYSWSSARIIVLIVIFALCMIVFFGIQIWRQENATVPPRIIKQRSIASGVWFSAFCGASLMLMVYYLPIWFQAIKGVSAVKSGIMSLPIVLALVVASIFTGAIVTNTGYYTPFLIASAIIISIGAGLITTFTPSTGHSKWIGYQVIFGFGIGLGMQQSGMAAQTVLRKKDVPTGVSLMFFFQNLGGALFVSIGQNIFTNKLVSGLAHVSDLDAEAIVNAGATSLRKIVDQKYLPEVLDAYNGALVHVYYVAVATTCTSIIGALTMEWRSVKKVREQQKKKELEQQKQKKEAKRKGDEAV